MELSALTKPIIYQYEFSNRKAWEWGELSQLSYLTIIWFFYHVHYHMFSETHEWVFLKKDINLQCLLLRNDPEGDIICFHYFPLHPGVSHPSFEINQSLSIAESWALSEISDSFCVQTGVDSFWPELPCSLFLQQLIKFFISSGCEFDNFPSFILLSVRRTYLLSYESATSLDYLKSSLSWKSLFQELHSPSLQNRDPTYTWDPIW